MSALMPRSSSTMVAFLAEDFLGRSTFHVAIFIIGGGISFER
jgi:hypothetical protein